MGHDAARLGTTHLRFTRRIKRTRSGQFEVRLSPEEREVLRGLPAQMRDALALGRDDPAVARLNPSACLDDAEVDAEFHRLMDNDLSAGRIEALDAFELLSSEEGIMPALETAHALAYLVKLAPKLKRSDVVIVNLSGRGDKDVQHIAKMKGTKL